MTDVPGTIPASRIREMLHMLLGDMADDVESLTVDAEGVRALVIQRHPADGRRLYAPSAGQIQPGPERPNCPMTLTVSIPIDRDA